MSLDTALLLKNAVYAIVWLYIYSQNEYTIKKRKGMTALIFIVFALPVNILHFSPDLIGIWANSFSWPFVANLILKNLEEKDGKVSSFLQKWETSLKEIIESSEVDRPEREEARAVLKILRIQLLGVKAVEGK